MKQSWDGIIPALRAGKFDAIMSGMSATAKREEVIAFTDPYGSTGQTFAVLEDSDLISGRVDAIMALMAYVGTAAKEPGNKGMVAVGPRFQGGMLGRGSSVGLRKDDTGLKQKFDTAIAAAKDDGTIRTLSAKWFGFDVTVY